MYSRVIVTLIAERNKCLTKLRNYLDRDKFVANSSFLSKEKSSESSTIPIP